MTESLEAKTIRKNRSTIADAISAQEGGPAWLANLLRQEDFTDNVDILSAKGLGSYDVVNRLLDPVEQRIRAPYCNAATEFFKFVRILKRKAVYTAVAEHLVTQYSKFSCFLQ